MPNKPALLAIVGPTASGKSHLAVELAKRHNGEIINCDSVQMFRQFDIGSGKLPAAEQEGIPHYLIGILNPEESYAAGEYARLARETILSLEARGKLPIIVGGTGFYLRALVDGLFPGPRRNAALRQRLQSRAEQKGRDYLHALLRRLDRVSAGNIHPNDSPKIIRALEVCLQARRPISELFRQGRQSLEGYQVLKLGLDPPRAELVERINRRTAGLFEKGLVEEVRAILSSGVPRTAPPFQSHGYRQVLEYLDGKLTIEETISLAQARTRQYAKSQMTWFRKESGVRWFSGFGTDPELQIEAGQYVLENLPQR